MDTTTLEKLAQLFRLRQRLAYRQGRNGEGLAWARAREDLHIVMHDQTEEGFEYDGLEFLDTMIAKITEVLEPQAPPRLTEIARQCRVIVERARKELGDDLGGFSMLDLVADNLPTVPLEELRHALVVAGLIAEVPGMDEYHPNDTYGN